MSGNCKMVRHLEGKHPNYFEAVLQLRECSEPVYQFVKTEIDKVGLKIAQVKKVMKGHDYYTADNSLTRALGKRLQREFGGHLLVTATLHTQKKGKELYRVTVPFRESRLAKRSFSGLRPCALFQPRFPGQSPGRPSTSAR